MRPRALDVGHIAVTSDEPITVSPRVNPDPEVGARWGRPASYVFNIEDPTDEGFDPNTGVIIKNPDDPIKRSINFVVNISCTGYITQHNYKAVGDVTDVTENSPPSENFRREHGLQRLETKFLKFNPENATFGWDEEKPKERIDQFKRVYKRYRYDLSFLPNRPSTNFFFSTTGEHHHLDGVQTGVITTISSWCPNVAAGHCIDESSPPDQDKLEGCISPGGYGAVIPFPYQFMTFGLSDVDPRDNPNKPNPDDPEGPTS